MKDMPPIPFPSKFIVWNFLTKRVPARARKHAGRTMQAKRALKQLEEIIQAKKEAKRKQHGHH